MTLGKVPQPLCAAAEQIAAREAEKTDFPDRGLDLAYFNDSGFGIHLSPPVISRYQAG
jgi:hypothetical protein